MHAPLLATKVSLPFLRYPFVPREAVLKRLHTGLAEHHLLVLISAPAGYGKTTALCLWLEELKHSVAWVRLEKTDNDLSGPQNTILKSFLNKQRAFASTHFACFPAMRGIINRLRKELVLKYPSLFSRSYLIKATMPPRTLTAEEIRAFLARANPPLLGVVGTLDEDGGPHLVPVWYRHDGERIHIWTIETRRWVKNLVRDARVAFSVQEDKPPYAAVSLRGHATITTSDSEAVTREIHQITRRYVEEANVEEYIQQWRHLRTIVSIIPDKVSGWMDQE